MIATTTAATVVAGVMIVVAVEVIATAMTIEAMAEAGVTTTRAATAMEEAVKTIAMAEIGAVVVGAMVGATTELLVAHLQKRRAMAAPLGMLRLVTTRIVVATIEMLVDVVGDPYLDY